MVVCKGSVGDFGVPYITSGLPEVPVPAQGIYVCVCRGHGRVNTSPEDLGRVWEPVCLCLCGGCFLACRDPVLTAQRHPAKHAEQRQLPGRCCVWRGPGGPSATRMQGWGRAVAVLLHLALDLGAIRPQARGAEVCSPEGDP